MVDLVEKHSPQEAKVAVLGLAYKPGTYVTEESVGLDLVKLLLNRGREVIAWDPLVTKDLLATGVAIGLDEALLAESLEDCLKDADVIVVTIPCQEFSQLPANPECISVVIDPWGIVDCYSSNKPFTEIVKHIQTGICQRESER